MIRELEVIVQRTVDGIEFRFSERTSFVTLLVTSNDGEELWKLKPAGMAAATIGESAFVAVPMEEAPGGASNALESLFAREPAVSLPSFARVIYGRVPEGYVEEQEAPALRAGERYAVIAMSARVYATGEFVA